MTLSPGRRIRSHAGAERRGARSNGTDEPRRPLDWLWDNIVQVVLMTGIFAYALSRLSYALFYGRLGLTPEDVGIRQDSIGAELAGVLLVVAVIIAAAAVLMAAGLLVLIVFLAFAAVAIYFGMAVSQALSVLHLFDWFMRFVLRRRGSRRTLSQRLSMFGGGGKLVRRGGEQALRGYGRLVRSPTGIMASIAVGVVLVCGLFIYTSDQALHDARLGRRVDPFRGFGPLFVTLRAYPASLHSVGAEAGSLDVPACVLYIGQVDAVHTIYDHVQHRTVRLDSGSVRVHVGPLMRSCSGTD
jgi:hypothetical protein